MIIISSFYIIVIIRYVDLPMCGNFQPLDRGSETQHHVVEN